MLPAGEPCIVAEYVPAENVLNTGPDVDALGVNVHCPVIVGAMATLSAGAEAASMKFPEWPRIAASPTEAVAAVEQISEPRGAFSCTWS
jgi:hypothetical protein